MYMKEEIGNLYVIASTVSKQQKKIVYATYKKQGGGEGAKPQMQTYFDVYLTYLNNVTHKAVFCSTAASICNKVYMRANGTFIYFFELL